MLTSKKIAVLLLSASISLGAFEAQAAKNLVGATLSKTGIDAGFTAALDSELKIGIAYPVAYHLTNNVGINIQGFAVKPVISGPAKFDVVNNDCPAVLPVGASCDFIGNVTATAPGNVTFQVHLVEGGNTFLLHKDTAIAVPQAPNLVGSSTLANPYFANNSRSNVIFTFKNTGVDTAVLSSVKLSDPAGLLSEVVNNCSGATISSGAFCKISAILTSGMIMGTYNLNFAFNYNEASSGSEVLTKDFPFTVTVVNTSKLEIVSELIKLVSETGANKSTQGAVTLKNTGNGDIVGINASVSSVDNGVLAVDESASTCKNNEVLTSAQTCTEVLDFTASSQAVGTPEAPSYKSALATLTINYQDGLHADPTLKQSVFVAQADKGYIFAEPTKTSAITAMVFARNTLYVGTPSNGLLMSSDHGATWLPAVTINGLPINKVTAVFANGNQVAVATDNGIALSKDGGFSFVGEGWNTGTNGTPQTIAQTNGITYVGTTNGLYSNTLVAPASFSKLTAVTSGVKAIVVNNGGNVFALSNDGKAFYNQIGEFDSTSFGTVSGPINCIMNGITHFNNNFIHVASSYDGIDYSCEAGAGVWVGGNSITPINIKFPAVNLSVIVDGGNDILYGLSGNELVSIKSGQSSWTSVSTGLTGPTMMAVDVTGKYIYVGSSTGGFAIGTIDANDPLIVKFD